MIKAHIRLMMYLMAKEYIDKTKIADKKVREVLLLCVRIFAVHSLLRDSEGLYECGYFGPGSQRLVEDSLYLLLTELRPHMIPIVESCGYDSQDHNVIGNKWGDIYELQLDLARKSRLNNNPVPSFYDKYQKPTMTMHKTPKL